MGCRYKSFRFVGVEQIVLLGVELCILVASSVAFVEHKRASGMGLNQGFSEIARFHLIHLLWCIVYCTTKIVFLFGPEICLCDPANILAVAYVGLFTAMWESFIRYWKRVTTAPGAKREWWQLRIVIYSTLYSAAAFVLLAMIYTCHPISLASYFVLALYLAFPFDSLILAIACLRRARELRAAEDSGASEATKQAYLFLVLPFSSLLGLVFFFFRFYDFDGQALVHVIPSILMLYLTWQRNYIKLSTNKSIGDLEMEWHSNSAYRSGTIHLNSSLSLGGQSSLSQEEPRDVESVFHAHSESMPGGELAQASPLTSHHEFYSCNESLEAIEDRNSKGIVTMGDFLSWSSAQRDLVVDDTLIAPHDAVVLARLYMLQIVLPVLDNEWSAHVKHVDALTANLVPTGGSGLGKLEEVRQYEEVKRIAGEHCETFKSFLDQTRVSASTLANIGNSCPVFKSSRQKKHPELAFLATNLFVACATLTSHESSGNGIQGEDVSPSSSSSSTPPTPVALSVVTVGAPAAHSMGFKLGGLREAKSKLDKSIRRHSASSAESQHLPAEIVNHLSLRFAVRARESVVLSQALQVVVTAAVEALSRCIEERNLVLLNQVSRIGLLVHSVSLLTTSGNEASMLDDFAGAYERLNVCLKFQHRPAATGGHAVTPPGVALAVCGVDSLLTSSHRHSRCGSDALDDHLPALSGMGNVAVTLAVAKKEDFEWMMQGRSDNQSIRLVPVLFTLGVNEMQSVANLASDATRIQTDINRHGLGCLRAYADDFERLRGESRLLAHSAGSSDVSALLESLENLVEAEARDKAKYVDLLVVSCTVARVMNGARTTSCKSAKDRTSMLHTLELCRIAERFEWLHRSREEEVLDELRGPNGVRLQNCNLNIGKMKYSFNKLQLQALPAELRPPRSTAAGGGAT